MGEAFTAVADDATAMYWNPAAMTGVDSHSATFMHAVHIDSSFFDYGAYVQKLGDRSALGIGVQYFSAGSISGTDSSGADIGSFTPNDFAVSFGYAARLQSAKRFLDGVSLGLAGKIIRSRIKKTAQTAAVDIGLLSPGYRDGSVRIALTVSNLGGTMRFGSTNEDLPLVLKFGASYKITDRWLLAADVGAPRDNGPYGAFGTEYCFLSNKASDVVVTGLEMEARNNGMSLTGRVGYNTRTPGDIPGFTGASFGIGFGLRQFDLDYGVVPFGDLGLTHRVSLSARF